MKKPLLIVIKKMRGDHIIMAVNRAIQKGRCLAWCSPATKSVSGLHASEKSSVVITIAIAYT
jgi:hypothetical protein